MIKSKIHAYRQICQPIITLILCASSVSAHAVIISDDSERRIQIRQSSSTSNNSNAYITPSTNSSNQRPGVTMLSGANASNSDSMQNLIVQKQRDFEIDARLSIEENKRVNVVRRGTTYSTANNTYNGAYNDYERYLSARVGSQNVPPLSQLLTTARSWSKCGYEPYQLPPQELWSNIVPTLRLYSELKNQGILPLSSEIRSVYRNPGLNDCAGGADGSKHMNASAMDIWVPEYEDNLWRLSTMHDGLCQFWQYQGQPYNFGLGLYATGAIHLDTDGYRKWGFNHASSSSSCRY
jgi:hypothetical protein